MKKVFSKIMAAFLVVMFAFAPGVANAKELTEDGNKDNAWGEPVAVIDYGDGWVGYQYESLIDPVGRIQLFAVAGKNIAVPTKLVNNGSDVCIITQYITFQYNRPDNRVVVNSAWATVENCSSTSEYYASGDCSTTSTNGSPATVTSSVGLYKRSNNSYVSTLNSRVYLYTDGTHE